MTKKAPAKKPATKTATKETDPLATEEAYSDASGTDTTAQDGAKARMETMTPTRRRGAVGQVETASGSKSG